MLQINTKLHVRITFEWLFVMLCSDDQCYYFLPFSTYAKDVPVYDIQSNVSLTSENSSMKTFDIDLGLLIHGSGSNVNGIDLWKVSAWLARSPSDTEIHGFVDQVCTFLGP